jgi:hypothetical protein
MVVAEVEPTDSSWADLFGRDGITLTFVPEGPAKGPTLR